MKVAIHQPNYIPSYGYFQKMSMVDTFVFLDDVQYEKKGFTNRTKLPNGQWMTVPVYAHDWAKINSIGIDNTKNWSRKHKRTIQLMYPECPWLEIYDGPGAFLSEVNIWIISRICEKLKIPVVTCRSSELDIEGDGHEKVLGICKKLGATQYISGKSWAPKHLKLGEFKNNGIDIVFPEFDHRSIFEVLKCQ